MKTVSSRFELRLPCSFPITFTITSRVPPHFSLLFYLSHSVSPCQPVLSLFLSLSLYIYIYIQQLYEDTGCSPEDLPEAMNDREGSGISLLAARHDDYDDIYKPRKSITQNCSCIFLPSHPSQDFVLTSSAVPCVPCPLYMYSW